MKVQHYHDTYEIYLQISGDRTLILNDVRYTPEAGGSVYPSSPLRFIIRRAGNPTPTSVILSIFPFRYCIPCFQKGKHACCFINWIPVCCIYPTHRRPEMLEHFKKADACHSRSGFLAEKLLCSVILQLLVLLGELLEDAGAKILWTAKASSLKSYPLSIISTPIIRKTSPWMPRPDWSI